MDIYSLQLYFICVHIKKYPVFLYTISNEKPRYKIDKTGQITDNIIM